MAEIAVAGSCELELAEAGDGTWMAVEKIVAGFQNAAAVVVDVATEELVVIGYNVGVVGGQIDLVAELD